MAAADDPAADSSLSDRRASRIGLWLFALYCLLYAGFIGLAVSGSRLLATVKLAGVNLAVLYGFGLIAAALVLAVVYLWACRRTDGR